MVRQRMAEAVAMCLTPEVIPKDPILTEQEATGPPRGPISRRQLAWQEAT
jgi:hypothetical protein